MDVQHLMKVLERLEEKVDTIRDSLHEIDVRTSGTMIKQAAQEKEIETLKTKVADLKTAHDRALGLASAPGILSLVYALSQIFAK